MDHKVGKGSPPRHSRFKKGQSGNPEGGRKHDPLKKALKTLTIEELGVVIKSAVTNTESSLSTELASKDITVMQKIVGKALLKAAKDGDYKTFNIIIERVVGKVT